MKIHAKPTISAAEVFRNLLSVRAVYSITVPHISGKIRAAANVTNCLPEGLNVLPLQVANQNHNVQTQRILFSCRTREMANFSIRVLKVFDHAVAALSSMAGTWIRIPAKEQLVTVPENFASLKIWYDKFLASLICKYLQLLRFSKGTKRYEISVMKRQVLLFV